MIFSTALTMRWRDVRQDAVQVPYHTVMQLDKTLSIVPLVHMMGGGASEVKLKFYNVFNLLLINKFKS